VSPSNGVVKLAELDEREVERLFFDMLLADDRIGDGSVS
jgi:hypothetical protein